MDVIVRQLSKAYRPSCAPGARTLLSSAAWLTPILLREQHSANTLRQFGYKAFDECCSLQWVHTTEGIANRFSSCAKLWFRLNCPCLNVTACGCPTIHPGWTRALARVRPRQLAPLCTAQAIRACSLSQESRFFFHEYGRRVGMVPRSSLKEGKYSQMVEKRTKTTQQQTKQNQPQPTGRDSTTN